jgi:hypothetical protein
MLYFLFSVPGLILDQNLHQDYIKKICDHILNKLYFIFLLTFSHSPLEKNETFLNGLTTDGVNSLLSINMLYLDGFCVSGFNFVYEDGSIVKTGYDGSDADYFTIDLNLKKIGWICDRVQICVVDLITAGRTCFDAGNRSLLTSLTGNKIDENTNIDENQHVANVYIDDDHCITTFYGEYADYYGNHCVRNLGIKYFG